jgi:hypothetical protein
MGVDPRTKASLPPLTTFAFCDNRTISGAPPALRH